MIENSPSTFELEAAVAEVASCVRAVKRASPDEKEWARIRFAAELEELRRLLDELEEAYE
jgi:hypothetical protein